MGSANLSLARGDTAAATELCMEVIRQGTHKYIHVICLVCNCLSIHQSINAFLHPPSIYSLYSPTCSGAFFDIGHYL